MSGDYSRWSFDPWRDFSAVLMQQGRVHTDADWNEWVTTILRRVQADALDTLGRAVVPRETPDGFLIQAAAGNLTIGPGRIYVDGLLAENHGRPPREWDPRLTELRGTGATPYDAQPFYPNPPNLPAGGPHLVYLKVWQREVSYIEDPRLVEPALGVDTTTRLQHAWQVRVLPNVGAAVTCATPLEDVPGFTAAEPAAAGRLSTGTADVPGEPDPCLVPPSGDYKGENQLFRVEIHRGGDFAGADQATFKWSRDNATVASRITAIPALDRIVVESLGRDAILRFSDGDWIEITDDVLELAGQPGEMRRIRSGNGVDDTTHTILLETALPAGRFPVDGQGRTTPSRNTRVRRWDHSGRVLDANGNLLVDLNAVGSNGTIPVPSSATSVLLENGVVVRFHLAPATGRFRSGDYWTFGARSTNAAVEILDQVPPRGIHAHYAKLALVTFPDTETDCRTLWPPAFGEEGCDCSVCVTAESHTSGALTIQRAIDEVRERGGTVCLGVGTYALREPLRIIGANSVRIRGQGASVLLAPGTGEAIQVDTSVGVTIERIVVVGATAQGTTSSVRIGNSVAVRVEDCIVVNLSIGDARGQAIGLRGYLLASAFARCALVAHTGIAAGVDGDGYAVTGGLQIVDNWLWCTHRGVNLARFTVHLAETRISGNTVFGCREIGLGAAGGNAPMGAFNVSGNFCSVEGTGIAMGVDALRLTENEIYQVGERAGDGIVLLRGLDASGIDHCQILGNRVRNVRGHGIAIRTRVNSGMIKHNIIAEVGGAGVVMEGDAQAGVLVVENNQLLNVAMAGNISGAHLAAMRFVGVRELDVRANAIHGFALEAQQAAERAAIRIIAVEAARVNGNTLSGVAPVAGFVGLSTGIEVVPPFRSSNVTDNSVRRRGTGEAQMINSTWIGLQVRGREGRDDGSFFALGDVAVATTAERGFVFTGTNAFAARADLLGDLTAHGNEISSQASDGPPIVVTAIQGCLLTGNQVTVEEGRSRPTLVRGIRVVISNNNLRGVGNLDVLDVTMLGKNTPAVLGNTHTGPILVNGIPLGEPWAELNPLVS